MTEQFRKVHMKTIQKKLHDLAKVIDNECRIDDDFTGGHVPEPEKTWIIEIYQIIDDIEHLSPVEPQSNEKDKLIAKQAELIEFYESVCWINRNQALKRDKIKKTIASLTSEIEEGDEKQDPVICVKCHEYSWDCKCAEKPELVSADSPHIEAMKFLKKKHGEQDYSDIPFWHVEDMVEYATLRAAQEKGKVPKNGYCSCDTQYAACDDKVECNGCKYWVESQTPVQSVSDPRTCYNKECFCCDDAYNRCVKGCVKCEKRIQSVETNKEK